MHSYVLRALGFVLELIHDRPDNWVLGVGVGLEVQRKHGKSLKHQN